uniref:Cadherin egf lag seven-pass g-type receptor n=1 Tax=Enterobius vermicularis TaxID=51028 RepID=A0A0N4VH37_ENTVE
LTNSVALTGTYNPERFQNVRINVVDVDEPPVFQNGPKPYLAVVPYTVPIGYQIYQFYARDEGGQGGNNVEYRFINSEPPGTFTVDSGTGIVRTAIRNYKPGKTYRVYVQASDRSPKNLNNSQNSEVAMLEIYAGDRAPQFLKQHYFVELPENTKIGKKVVDVRANSFPPIDSKRQKSELTYHLYIDNDDELQERSEFFTINEKTGDVILMKELDYDDLAAQEDGKESSVPLEIRVKDVNDNRPIFTQILYTATVKEDIPVGKTIITVHADDKDSEENSRVLYSVDDHNFVVNERGEISAKNRLDADQKRERFYFYRFNVTAKDNGNPPSKSKAMVQIRTENTNDEPPVFIPTNSYTAFVAEDAQGGTPVIRVQALDPDRDQVYYWFLLPNGQRSSHAELFDIDKDTGLIKLHPSATPQDLKRTSAPHNLTVVATDDGSCCLEPSNLHETLATVSIDISDVNNNKPEFRDCKSYSQRAKIVEGDYKIDRPVIIKVTATDEDSSLNGEIVYSLYHPQSESRKPFIIDPVTGELRPSPYVRFDREQRAFEEVTVKATDKGEPPLIGFCQFTVQVKDVNDNAPQFDRASYETSISKTAPIGYAKKTSCEKYYVFFCCCYSVVTVFADDSDAPQNARITYSLAPDPSADFAHKRDIEYFTIAHKESGEIKLKKAIPMMTDRFIINVVASDNGSPPQNSTVQVTVKVHEKQQNAPQWQSSEQCKDSVTVDEDIQTNSVIIRCHAIAGDGSKHRISYRFLSFRITNAVNRGINLDKYFRVYAEKENGRDWFSLRTYDTLDYEKQNNFTITLTAMDVQNSVTSDKQFQVFLRDKNDNVPRFTVDLFTGTVEEEQTVEEYMKKHDNQPVTVVTAVDADSPGPQSDVRYRILGDNEIQRLFRIEETTGKIYPTATYDREKNDTFIFDVEARDSLQSSLPGIKGPNRDIVKVQIFVADVNDNPPYFDKKRYEGRVLENEEVNQDVITLKAYDLDSRKYHLVLGERIPFGVRTDSGVIFVKEPLDYEKENEYHMIAFVTDGKHNTTTDVFIYVEDVNDNAPEFEKSLYETTILEEDHNVPKTLFMVKATDKDRDETSKKIIYRLEGQGVNEYFRVDKRTGKIEVVLPLDRDPPGIPVWRFIVQAIDDDGKGLIGYADVQVNLEDINDNAPQFPSDMYGEIEENRDPGHDGVYVMTVTATDNDDPATSNAKLEYSIVANKAINGKEVFRIDKDTGKIYSMIKLDREKPSENQFLIQVRASDHGYPKKEEELYLLGTGNVTIRVLDVNDNPPYFPQQYYDGNVLETVPVGTAVMSIKAMDNDTEARDNVFEYSLTEEHKYFYMTTESETSGENVGVLRVKQVGTLILKNHFSFHLFL